MRYEFERDGVVVASVLWEGPAQVSVEAADSSTRAVVDRYLSSEVVYLGSGFDFGAEHGARRPADAPPRLDAVGVRAGVPEPGPPPAGARQPGRDRPGRSPGGGRPMKMSGADALLKALEQEGVEAIFGIPGGASMPIYDPLVDRSSIRHILCRHEQGAGHAAEGYAWVTGKVGRLHGDLRPRARRTSSRRSPTRRWIRSRSSRSRDRCRPRWSATTPSRRPTSPASRCRSRSTTSW